MDGLERAGVKAALDYSAEANRRPWESRRFRRDRTFDRVCPRNKNVAYAVFKLRRRLTDTLLAKASEHPETLTAAGVPDSRHSPRFRCALRSGAPRHGVRILVDAEDVRFRGCGGPADGGGHARTTRTGLVFATLR